MGSAIAGELPGMGAFIQHRDELVAQNRRTFWQVNRNIPSDIFTAERKRWVSDGWTFGMIQTIGRNLNNLPTIDNLMIDEAHHAAAPTYLKAIDVWTRKNPRLIIVGLTATPNRGDKRALRGIFSHCFDQITLKELIATGFLVRPRTFVIDVGVQEQLRNVRKLASDFDMSAVEQIMDKDPLNEKIVEEWKKLAGDRRTVAFASTIQHAEHFAGAVRAAGVSCAVVHGELSDGERSRILAAFDRGEFQFLVNVAILTEGWDCQPVSCVLLLRPSSFKSTVLQMIGRGLRKVDPERYPGIVKDDCIVIDFGTSLITHFASGFEEDLELDGKGQKLCPECDANIPAQCYECPICGHEFEREAAPTKECEACHTPNGLTARSCKECGHPFPEPEAKGVLGDFVLTEVDLLQQSPYRWETIFDGMVMVADAMTAWAFVVHYHGRWHAVAGSKDSGTHYLTASSDRIIALASADDFMREHGDSEAAQKNRRWLSLPPTDKQLTRLGLSPMEALGISRYRAACLMSWHFSERTIRRILEGSAPRAAA